MEVDEAPPSGAGAVLEVACHPVLWNPPANAEKPPVVSGWSMRRPWLWPRPPPPLPRNRRGHRQWHVHHPDTIGTMLARCATERVPSPRGTVSPEAWERWVHRGWTRCWNYRNAHVPGGLFTINARGQHQLRDARGDVVLGPTGHAAHTLSLPPTGVDPPPLAFVLAPAFRGPPPVAAPSARKKLPGAVASSSSSSTSSVSVQARPPTKGTRKRKDAGPSAKSTKIPSATDVLISSVQVQHIVTIPQGLKAVVSPALGPWETVEAQVHQMVEKVSAHLYVGARFVGYLFLRLLQEDATCRAPPSTFAQLENAEKLYQAVIQRRRAQAKKEKEAEEEEEKAEEPVEKEPLPDIIDEWFLRRCLNRVSRFAPGAKRPAPLPCADEAYQIWSEQQPYGDAPSTRDDQEEQALIQHGPFMDQLSHMRDIAQKQYWTTFANYHYYGLQSHFGWYVRHCRGTSKKMAKYYVKRWFIEHQDAKMKKILAEAAETEAEGEDDPEEETPAEEDEDDGEDPPDDGTTDWETVLRPEAQRVQALDGMASHIRLHYFLLQALEARKTSLVLASASSSSSSSSSSSRFAAKKSTPLPKLFAMVPLVRKHRMFVTWDKTVAKRYFQQTCLAELISADQLTADCSKPSGVKPDTIPLKLGRTLRTDGVQCHIPWERTEMYDHVTDLTNLSRKEQQAARANHRAKQKTAAVAAEKQVEEPATAPTQRRSGTKFDKRPRFPTHTKSFVAQGPPSKIHGSPDTASTSGASSTHSVSLIPGQYHSDSIALSLDTSGRLPAVVTRIVGLDGGQLNVYDTTTFERDEKQEFVEVPRAREPPAWIDPLTQTRVSGRSLTKGHYYVLKGNRRYRQWLQRHKAAHPELVTAEHELSLHSLKLSDPDQYLENVMVQLRHWRTLRSFYGQVSMAQRRFAARRRHQQLMDWIVWALVPDTKHTIVAFGAATFAVSQRGGGGATPIFQILRALSRHCVVIMIDEYNTTQMCFHCKDDRTQPMETVVGKRPAYFDTTDKANRRVPEPLPPEWLKCRWEKRHKERQPPDPTSVPTPPASPPDWWRTRWEKWNKEQARKEARRSPGSDSHVPCNGKQECPPAGSIPGHPYSRRIARTSTTLSLVWPGRPHHHTHNSRRYHTHRVPVHGLRHCPQCLRHVHRDHSASGNIGWVCITFARIGKRPRYLTRPVQLAPDPSKQKRNVRSRTLGHNSHGSLK